MVFGRCLICLPSLTQNSLVHSYFYTTGATPQSVRYCALQVRTIPAAVKPSDISTNPKKLGIGDWPPAHQPNTAAGEARCKQYFALHQLQQLKKQCVQEGLPPSAAAAAMYSKKAVLAVITSCL